MEESKRPYGGVAPLREDELADVVAEEAANGPLTQSKTLAAACPRWARLGAGWRSGVTGIHAYALFRTYTNQNVPLQARPGCQRRYGDDVVVRVRDGEFDANIREAAVCVDTLRGWREIISLTPLFVQGVAASQKTILSRLKDLDYKANFRSWEQEVDAKVAVLDEEFEGREFTDEDGTWVVRGADIADTEELRGIAIFYRKKDGLEDSEECSPIDEVRAWLAGEELESDPEPDYAPSAPAPAQRLTRKLAVEYGKRRKKRKTDRRAAAEGRAAAAAAVRETSMCEEDRRFETRALPPGTARVGDPRATTVPRLARALLDSTDVQTRTLRRWKPLGSKYDIENPSTRCFVKRICAVEWEADGDPSGRLMVLAGREIGRLIDAAADAGKSHIAHGVKLSRCRHGATGVHLVCGNDGTLTRHSRAVVAWIRRLVADSTGDLKTAMAFFLAFVIKSLEARTLWIELARYLPGQPGADHRDQEEEDIPKQHDASDFGGSAKGGTKALEIEERLALLIDGERPMSLLDRGAGGPVVTFARSAAGRRGVLFHAGAHTKERGEIKHRNDAGDDAGLTMIVTWRRDATTAFDGMSSIERLAAHTPLRIYEAS